MDKDRLGILAARWRLGTIPMKDLRQVASDLLDEGSPFRVSSSCIPLPEDAVVWKGRELFECALRELNVADLGADESAERLSSWLAEEVLNEGLAPEEACGQGAWLYYTTGYEHQAFAEWYGLDDEYGSVGSDGLSWERPKAEIDEAVRELARKVSAPRS